jgi:arabinofuranosyltransferase
MSGRHFAIPLFVAIATLVHLLNWEGIAIATSAVLALYVVFNPVSPVKFGSTWYVPHGQDWSYLDTKYFALKEGTALLDWRPDRPLPDHNWLRYGTQMRLSAKRVFVGAGDPNWDGVPGVVPGSAVGFAGFAAGPDKFIIDVVALGDPLLARLPAIRPATYADWKSGHFYRQLPAGYVESVINRGNMIEDRDLHEFYNVIRTITRGPIWSTRRLIAIALVNVGAYDHLLEEPSAGP